MSENSNFMNYPMAPPTLPTQRSNCSSPSNKRQFFNSSTMKHQSTKEPTTPIKSSKKKSAVTPSTTSRSRLLKSATKSTLKPSNNQSNSQSAEVSVGPCLDPESDYKQLINDLRTPLIIQQINQNSSQTDESCWEQRSTVLESALRLISHQPHYLFQQSNNQQSIFLPLLKLSIDCACSLRSAQCGLALALIKQLIVSMFMQSLTQSQGQSQALLTTQTINQAVNCLLPVLGNIATQTGGFNEAKKSAHSILLALSNQSLNQSVNQRLLMFFSNEKWSQSKNKQARTLSACMMDRAISQLNNQTISEAISECQTCSARVIHSFAPSNTQSNNQLLNLTSPDLQSILIGLFHLYRDGLQPTRQHAKRALITLVQQLPSQTLNQSIKLMSNFEESEKIQKLVDSLSTSSASATPHKQAISRTATTKLKPPTNFGTWPATQLQAAVEQSNAQSNIPTSLSARNSAEPASDVHRTSSQTSIQSIDHSVVEPIRRSYSDHSQALTERQSFDQSDLPSVEPSNDEDQTVEITQTIEQAVEPSNDQPIESHTYLPTEQSNEHSTNQSDEQEVAETQTIEHQEAESNEQDDDQFNPSPSHTFFYGSARPSEFPINHSNKHASRSTGRPSIFPYNHERGLVSPLSDQQQGNGMLDTEIDELMCLDEELHDYQPLNQSTQNHAVVRILESFSNHSRQNSEDQVNQSINRSFTQSINQSLNRSFQHQPLSLADELAQCDEQEEFNQANDQMVDQQNTQLNDQPVNELIDQPDNESSDQEQRSNTPSNNQSINEPGADDSIAEQLARISSTSTASNQSVNQSNNQPERRSINQSLARRSSMKRKRDDRSSEPADEHSTSQLSDQSNDGRVDGQPKEQGVEQSVSQPNAPSIDLVSLQAMVAATINRSQAIRPIINQSINHIIGMTDQFHAQLDEKMLDLLSKRS